MCVYPGVAAGSEVDLDGWYVAFVRLAAGSANGFSVVGVARVVDWPVNGRWEARYVMQMDYRDASWSEALLERNSHVGSVSPAPTLLMVTSHSL